MIVAGYLRAGAGNDGYLRGEKYPASYDGYLYAEGYYLRPGSFLRIDQTPPSLFPTQYAGLRFYDGAVKELALVALADANSGVRVRKAGETFSVYLVPTTDPDASPIRIFDGSSVLAARLKT